MKRILYTVLTLMLVFSCLVCGVSADETVISGKCGKNLTWAFSEATGTLTISGTGDMKNYDESDDPAPWQGLNVEKAVIENGVTSIGNYAFYNFYGSHLTDIAIPDSVSVIGICAFENCYQLTKITIPNSVTTIKMAAFRDCKNLKEIAIPTSVTKLESEAFSHCLGLTRVTVPGNIGEVADRMFFSCSNLESVIIEEGITKIRREAFDSCSRLKSVTIPDSVTEIQSYAFDWCSSLLSVDIPDGVTAIGWSAFGDCDSLTEIVIPDSVVTLGRYIFDGCDDLVSVTLSRNLQYIDDYSFRSCDRLQSITIPASVEYIGAEAFSKCKSLTNVIIEPGVKEIENYAFSECVRLKNIVIPGSIAEMGEYVFSQCTGLKEVTVEEGVKSIEDYAFSKCTSLTDVTLPKSLTSIKKRAFYMCTALEHITLPEKLTYIGYAAFHRCEALKSISIPVSLDHVGERAFSWCDNLTDVYYSGSTETRKSLYVDRSNSELLRATWHYGTISAPKITLTADTGTGQTRISWETVKGARRYELYRATNKNGPYELLRTTVTLTDYADKTAQPGTKYYYKLLAVAKNDQQASAYSQIASRTCDLPVPQVSISTTFSSGKSKICWNFVDGAVKYRVYRSESKNGTYSLVKTTVTVSSFTDRNAEPGINYYYKVKAVHTNSDGNSALSTAVNRVCDLSRPVVTIALSKGGSPQLQWADVEDAAKYRVYRSTSKEGTYKLIRTTTAAKCTDTSASTGTRYYYKVRAIHKNSNANSAYSSVKSITAK